MERLSATDVVSVEVPDIGDFVDVPVIEILVSAGDEVAADDPLLTLESDKATMDVPAPFAGEIREISVKIGDRVSQGAVLLSMLPSAGAAGGARAASIASEGVPSEAAAPAAVQGVLDAEPPLEASETAESAAEVPVAPPAYASPLARRIAQERGIDLGSVAGSGRGGRITVSDLQGQDMAGDTPVAPHAPTPPAPPIPLAPWPQIDFARFGPVELVPRTRIQQIAAPNLVRNWTMIPHVTHHDEADITDLERWRLELNGEQEVKVTMLAFLVAACVTALQKFPDFNASLDGDELVRKHYFNIGFAADTPQGLVVPVIRGADGKRLLETARELSELAGRARAGKLGPPDITGGTFSISSLGGIGGTGFTPIVNAPEVAILGVSKAAMKPVWNRAEFIPRLMLPLSLSYDHRVIDGAAAARFVSFLSGVLGDLRRVLL